MTNILINENIDQCTGNLKDITKPPGWSVYLGSGTILGWGSSTIEYATNPCSAYISGQTVDIPTKIPPQAEMNISLHAGDSDGYSGLNAYPIIPNNTYYLKFKIKSDFKWVTPSILYWRTITATIADRVIFPLTMSTGETDILPTNGLWKTYNSIFVMPSDAVKAVVSFHSLTWYPLGTVVSGTMYIDDVILDTCAPLTCNLDII